MEHKPQYFDNKNVNKNVSGDLKFKHVDGDILKDNNVTVACHVVSI